MASVFLSYDRDDVRKARPIADALEKAGHSVWWDRHIKGGSQFSKVIEEALKAADAVVVLWSAQSVDSPWVRDEAAAGRDVGRLIPISLDETEPPLGFRQYQTIDLSRWKGRGSPEQLKALIADIETIAAKSEPPVSTVAAGPRGKVRQDSRLSIGPFAVAGVLLIAFVAGAYWWSHLGEAAIPQVAVVAGDSSKTSQRMAADVLVALGSLQNSGASALRLLDAQDSKRATLKLTVTGSQDKGQVTGNVALTNAADKSVLWSRQFRRVAGSNGTIEEMIAPVAGRVLRCAADEVDAKRGILDRDLRQHYLNACVASDEISWDARPLIPMLRKVTDNAPDFAPAWARLLDAEATAIRNLQPRESVESLRLDLQRDLAHARRAFPDMPEIRVAEVSLNPDWPMHRAIALLDEGVKSDPQNSNLVAARSEYLAAVGRVLQAAEDAERAAELDKVSPIKRAAAITALILAGKVEDARAELAKARRVWPDSESIAYAQTLIDLRYGDFVEALPRSGARMDGGIFAYIKARSEPTPANKDAFIKLARTHQMNPSQKRFLFQALPELDRVDDLYSLAATWPTDRTLLSSTDILFAPWTARFRRDPRFMGYARRVRLLDYWQTSGIWPDFCSEPDMPYDCKAEAVKLG